MHAQPTIGILGGMGPKAGLDLFQAVMDNTLATRDQDHVPTLLWSAAHVPDRTAFLLQGAGNPAEGTLRDPAPPMGRALVQLAGAGATTAAVACNTAHAEPIFRRVQEHVRQSAPGLTLLHMIHETVASISGRKIGLLATAGTYRLRLYDDALAKAGFTAILPSEDIRENHLFPAIYDPESGIKAASSPVTDRAREAVALAIEHLLGRGAERVILGCTELPLAVGGHHALHPYVINPTRIVARALIRATFPHRLKPTPC